MPHAFRPLISCRWAEQQRSRDGVDGRSILARRSLSPFHARSSSHEDAPSPVDGAGGPRGIAGTAGAALAVAAAAAAGGGQGGGFRSDGGAVAFVPPSDWPASDAPAPPLLYNRVDLDGRRSSATEEEMEEVDQIRYQKRQRIGDIAVPTLGHMDSLDSADTDGSIGGGQEQQLLHAREVDMGEVESRGN